MYIHTYTLKLRTYIYIYICACVCVCVCVYTYIYIYKYRYLHSYTYTHMHTHKHKHTHINACSCTCVCTNIQHLLQFLLRGNGKHPLPHCRHCAKNMFRELLIHIYAKCPESVCASRSWFKVYKKGLIISIQ